MSTLLLFIDFFVVGFYFIAFLCSCS